MPKEIDPELKAQADGHRPRRGLLLADGCVGAVAKKLGFGSESVRRWALQAQADAGQRDSPTSDDLAEIKALKAKVRRLEEDNAILEAATVFFAGGNSTPAIADDGFHRPAQRSSRVESIWRVLRAQGCRVAARTYRFWKQPGRPVDHPDVQRRSGGRRGAVGRLDPIRPRSRSGRSGTRTTPRSWSRSTASTKPNACAPACSTPTPTRRWPTSNLRRPAGSSGTASAGCIPTSAWSHRPSTSKPTTLPSSESRNPYSSGGKPGALQR